MNRKRQKLYRNSNNRKKAKLTQTIFDFNNTLKGLQETKNTSCNRMPNYYKKKSTPVELQDGFKN